MRDGSLLWQGNQQIIHDKSQHDDKIPVRLTGTLRSWKQQKYKTRIHPPPTKYDTQQGPLLASTSTTTQTTTTKRQPPVLHRLQSIDLG